MQDRLSYGEYFALQAENVYVSAVNLDSLEKRGPLNALYRTAGLSRQVGGSTPQVLVISTTGALSGVPEIGVLPEGYTGAESGGYALERGGKAYEFTNHLSNVLAILSDKKLGQDTNTDDIAENYEPEVRMLTDYYPFGMAMPARTWQSGTYRYGFQGQEGDNEVVGEGSAYAYTYRMSDSRLGRFWSVDPLAGKYPWNSVYAFSENVVINAVELEGLEKSESIIAAWSSGDAGQNYQDANENGPLQFHLENFVSKGEADYIRKIGYPKAFAVKLTVAIASDLAKSLDLDSDNGFHNEPMENAFRHAFGQALLASFFGYNDARDAGNAHEEGHKEIFEKYPDEVKLVMENLREDNVGIPIFMNHSDSFVDQLNNEIGRNVGILMQNRSVSEIAQVILYMLKDGRLYYAEPFHRQRSVNGIIDKEASTDLIRLTNLSDNSFSKANLTIREKIKN